MLVSLYLLTPWSRVLLEKLTGLQLVKKFPAFYWTRRFIIAFTIAYHLSLSWASPIQSIPLHPTSWRSILILSSYLCLGLRIGLSLRFPHQNPIHASLLLHPHYMPHPSHSSWFYHMHNIGLEVLVSLYCHKYIYVLSRYVARVIVMCCVTNASSCSGIVELAGQALGTSMAQGGKCKWPTSIQVLCCVVVKERAEVKV
jgi:hypothetical protein